MHNLLFYVMLYSRLYSVFKKKLKKKKTTKTISEQSKIDILRKDTNNRTLEREEHQTSKRVEHFC